LSSAGRPHRAPTDADGIHEPGRRRRGSTFDYY
jgi:hypothetical protein